MLTIHRVPLLYGSNADTYKLTEQDEVSKTYSFQKSCISYRKPRAVSTEQRNGQGR